MSVEVDNHLSESLEELLHRHRKEKKELQSKIQALKKTATKGDKKRKKEVTEEILKLETELENKQSSEVASLKNGEFQVESVTNDVNLVSLSDGDESSKNVRLSKAQKRRNKKEMLLKERELRIAEQESQNIGEARQIELEAIQNILQERGLMIKEIPSDGDCLYNAVRSGLNEMTLEDLRSKTATVLRGNVKKFLPFVSHPDTGEILTEEQYEDYCNQVQSTKAWGGHIELMALSEALECCIEVIQSTGPSVFTGSSYKDKSHIVLTYHRHLYNLGEHYNAVQPIAS